MSSSIFRLWNGAGPTAAVLTPIDTGTAIKTMLQVLGKTGIILNVKAWGVSMTGAAAAAGVQWELIETTTVAATVTAHVEADCIPVNQAALNATAATFFNFGTEATGYTSSAEDTVVSPTRLLDAALVQPTGERSWEFSLGNGREISDVSVLRVRCLAAVAVNAICWVEIEV